MEKKVAVNTCLNSKLIQVFFCCVDFFLVNISQLSLDITDENTY